MFGQFLKSNSKGRKAVKRLFAYGFCALMLFTFACSELEKPKTEDYYSASKPPQIQEFRWSNGQMPKSFDPAKASAPPETDIVRAVYDGLTENHPKTLNAVPALAYKWKSSEDKKVWTFKLRRDAKWSNGEKITAKDFVRSWKRLADMGDDVSHNEILKNIVGMKPEKVEEEKKEEEAKEVKKDKTDIFSLRDTAKEVEKQKQEILETISKEKKEQITDTVTKDKNETLIAKSETPKTEAEKNPNDKKVVAKKKTAEKEFGVKAIGRHTLRVSLIKPDKDFPELVANPIFRPVYANGDEFKDNGLNADIVTSGAFRVSSVGRDGITLDRAEHYYNKENVKLDRVQFIPAKDADSALQAYKDGKVDAVTNAKFEPLALKLLTPYFDFKKVTHSALNFYEFNRKKEPFNDRRVRQALAISIDRKRLASDEMEGATKPAFNFLPFEEKQRNAKIKENISQAKKLLATAGFPEGEGFPPVKLYINRNNIQQRIAKAVAEMWKQNLNIETEIVVKEYDELEMVKKDGEFDVIRRGIVLPTTDETANMMAIFSPKRTPESDTEEKESKVTKETQKEKSAELEENNKKPNEEIGENSNAEVESFENTILFQNELLIDTGVKEFILTEEEAILEVPAIPLYFPTSYSLVKPYVEGFEMNTLDAPLLKDVKINNNWQPNKPKDES